MSVALAGRCELAVGEIDTPVVIGGATIRPGDVLVLDADGGAVVERERVEQVLAAALQREANESVKRARLQRGELSYEIDGLRALVQGASR
jgi:4-hydroxy-4-methyl-2-oxoglutarate aldolase